MKKGFTLVELLAVITILALLALLTATAITKIVKDSKGDLYNTQIVLIKSAAQMWGSDNMDKLPSAGNCSYITLEDLKNEGYMDSNVINPKNKEQMSNNLQIKISTTTTTAGRLKTEYEVDPEDVDGCSRIELSE